jgi:membrane fusion protein (multidrug efflux system)
MLLLVGLAVVGAALAWKAFDYLTVGRFLVSTDDAYVRANMATISAKVSGYVVSVDVVDNQEVKAGDLLARIDPGDYELAVETARKKIATQGATIARIANQVEAQRNAVDQARALMSAAQAEGRRARSDYGRVDQLIKKSFVSKQRLDQALAERDRSEANIANMQASVLAAEATLRVYEAQEAEAVHLRAELETALAKAERDLSFTEIRAPFDGVVGNKAVQPGQFIQPGARLLALVPLVSAYIEANFKETQLSGLKRGQIAHVVVDACAECGFDGRVESLAPASGSQYSLLPPENATGNFTKIVQRLPVRIAVPAGVAAKGVLRPGLSVVVEVDTRPGEAGSEQRAAAR